MKVITVTYLQVHMTIIAFVSILPIVGGGRKGIVKEPTRNTAIMRNTAFRQRIFPTHI